MTELTQIPIDRMAISTMREGRPLPYPSASQIADAMENGINDLVVVRRGKNPTADTPFEILRGVDVWMLAQRVRVHTVPAMVVVAGDEAARSLVDTDVGADPITTAKGMQELMDDRGCDITSLARDLRIPRTTVSNHLRLLKLHPDVKDLVKAGELSMRHAKLLLGVSTRRQLTIAEKVTKNKLSTRQTAQLVGSRETKNEGQQGTAPPRGSSTDKDPDTIRLENRIGEILGSKVSIDYEPGGRGQLTVDFHNFEGLEGVLERLGYSEF